MLNENRSVERKVIFIAGLLVIAAFVLVIGFVVFHIFYNVYTYKKAQAEYLSSKVNYEHLIADQVRRCNEYNAALITAKAADEAYVKAHPAPSLFGTDSKTYIAWSVAAHNNQTGLGLSPCSVRMGSEPVKPVYHFF